TSPVTSPVLPDVVQDPLTATHPSELAGGAAHGTPSESATRRRPSPSDIEQETLSEELEAFASRLDASARELQAVANALRTTPKPSAAGSRSPVSGGRHPARRPQANHRRKRV